MKLKKLIFSVVSVAQRRNKRVWQRYCWTFLAVLTLGLSSSYGFPTQIEQWKGFKSEFQLSENADFSVTLLEQSAPANLFIAGEQPVFTVQIENLSASTLRETGKVWVIPYSGDRVVGNQWNVQVNAGKPVSSGSIRVDLKAKGWENLEIRPNIPETKGSYALVVDLGEHGRQFLTTLARVFKPDHPTIPGVEPFDYGKQVTEAQDGEIVWRMGFRAVGRQGVPFAIPGSGAWKDIVEERLYPELESLIEHNITTVIEFGAPSSRDVQPLGRPRPHLDDNDVMKAGKSDMAWLPEYDDEFYQQVREIVGKYGYPKGPIVGVMLWNEPWEGLSISGWGGDMIRYREIYKTMGDAVFEARKKDGVTVLVGGCDSDSNTRDKLLGEGYEKSPFWPKYLDFCSVHYQGVASPAFTREWRNREHYKGRVRIWDTESWVANTADTYPVVVSVNRAVGYDRAMGSLARYAVSSLSHHRVAHDMIWVENEKKKIKVERPLNSTSLAVAYSATNYFIGDRPFREVLFENSRPWVFVFDGYPGRQEDGTALIVGTPGKLFGKKKWLYDSVERLDETVTPTMTLRNSEAYALFDFNGNRVKSGEDIEIPLDERGHFLRPNPRIEGAFENMLSAIRNARIEGFEPVEMIPYDMTKPIAQHPVIKLRVTNQLPNAIEGKLLAEVEGLKLDYPKTVALAPRERKWVELKVVGGKQKTNNLYPLTVKFETQNHGTAIDEDNMRVNFIRHKTIEVDGDLRDWEGALPQVAQASGDDMTSFEEQMWLPFMEFEATSGASNTAIGYVGYDDDYFYFGCKASDDSPEEGTIRFATRDHDLPYYPEVSYEKKNGNIIEHRWPEDVRRFSYRMWPHLPSSHSSRRFDNVLIGFNAIPMDEEDDVIADIPGAPDKLIDYKTTDHQYALNKVHPDYGGGTEVWRLEVPGMIRKHFFARQPAHPLEGAVKKAKLAIRHTGGTRYVECAIPWTEIPAVHELMKAKKPLKFSYRVNHGNSENRLSDLELTQGRPAAEGTSNSFHPDWHQSFPNDIAFGWEE